MVGMLKDDMKTLAAAGMRPNAKVMLVGSSSDERKRVESETVPKPLFELRNPQGMYGPLKNTALASSNSLAKL